MEMQAIKPAVCCDLLSDEMPLFLVSSGRNKRAWPYYVSHVVPCIDALVKHRNIHTFSEVVVKNKSIASYRMSVRVPQDKNVNRRSM
jgi:hypothetical protein